MTPTTTALPRAALRGFATGTIFMAFFGTLWASIGVGGLAGRAAPWPLVAALLIGVTLLAGGIALWRGAGRLRDEPLAGGDAVGRQFGLVFALEGVAIAIASVACNATGHFALFFPIMAIIVGVHFLPLARLFDVAPYYAVGVLLCLLGIVGLVAVPVETTLAGHAIMARWLVVGGGCAAILWGTGLGLWIGGARALRGSLPA